jgi:autotransporter-associated beta strand protein
LATGYRLHTFTSTGSSTLTFDALAATISGIVSGGNQLTVNAAGGAITLSSANTHTGGTTVSGGLLLAGIASTGSPGSVTNGAFGTGTLTVQSGFTADLNGFNQANALNLSGTGLSNNGALINSSSTASTVSGAVTLAAASTLGGSGNHTLSGSISGAFALTKVGAGTITLSGESNALTTLLISAGQIQVGSGSTTGVLGSGAVTNNGTLIFNRSNDFTV